MQVDVEAAAVCVIGRGLEYPGFLQRSRLTEFLTRHEAAPRVEARLGPGGAAGRIPRGKDHTWTAKWLHLNARGTAWANRIESNRVSTALLARPILRRDYLTVSYMVDLLRAKAGSYTPYTPGMATTEPVTFIGIERPDGLPDGSQVLTLPRLNELIPQ